MSTLYTVQKAISRAVRNTAYNQIEVKTLDATCSDAKPIPYPELLQDIEKSNDNYESITGILLLRLNEQKHPLHMIRAMKIAQDILTHSSVKISSRFLEVCVENQPLFESLTQYRQQHELELLQDVGTVKTLAVDILETINTLNRAGVQQTRRNSQIPPPLPASRPPRLTIEEKNAAILASSPRAVTSPTTSLFSSSFSSSSTSTSSSSSLSSSLLSATVAIVPDVEVVVVPNTTPPNHNNSNGNRNNNRGLSYGGTSKDKRKGLEEGATPILGLKHPILRDSDSASNRADHDGDFGNDLPSLSHSSSLDDTAGLFAAFTVHGQGVDAGGEEDDRVTGDNLV